VLGFDRLLTTSFIVSSSAFQFILVMLVEAAMAIAMEKQPRAYKFSERL
jgi:hypothetical protein